MAEDTSEELVGRISMAVEAERETLIEMIQELVRIPSVTGEEGAVQEVVAARIMNSRRFEWSIDLE